MIRPVGNGTLDAQKSPVIENLYWLCFFSDCFLVNLTRVFPLVACTKISVQFDLLVKQYDRQTTPFWRCPKVPFVFTYGRLLVVLYFSNEMICSVNLDVELKLGTESRKKVTGNCLPTKKVDDSTKLAFSSIVPCFYPQKGKRSPTIRGSERQTRPHISTL